MQPERKNQVLSDDRTGTSVPRSQQRVPEKIRKGTKSMSARLIRLYWKKMGLRRFQNLEVILLFNIYIESVLLRLTMFPMNQIYSKGIRLKELRKNLVF